MTSSTKAHRLDPNIREAAKRVASWLFIIIIMFQLVTHLTLRARGSCCCPSLKNNWLTIEGCLTGFRHWQQWQCWQWWLVSYSYSWFNNLINQIKLTWPYRHCSFNLRQGWMSNALFLRAGGCGLDGWSYLVKAGKKLTGLGNTSSPWAPSTMTWTSCCIPRFLAPTNWNIDPVNHLNLQLFSLTWQPSFG